MAMGLCRYFRQFQKRDVKHYVLYQPQEEISAIQLFTRQEFEKIHIKHWNVENFFRTVKQCCQAEKFFVRDTKSIKHTFFAS